MNFLLYAEYNTLFGGRDFVDLDITLSNKNGKTEAEIYNDNGFHVFKNKMSSENVTALLESVNDEKITNIIVGSVFANQEDVDVVLNYLRDLEYYKENPDELPRANIVENAIENFFEKLAHDSQSDRDAVNRFIYFYNPSVLKIIALDNFGRG